MTFITEPFAPYGVMIPVDAWAAGDLIRGYRMPAVKL